MTTRTSEGGPQWLCSCHASIACNDLQRMSVGDRSLNHLRRYSLDEFVPACQASTAPGALTFSTAACHITQSHRTKKEYGCKSALAHSRLCCQCPLSRERHEWQARASPTYVRNSLVEDNVTSRVLPHIYNVTRFPSCKMRWS